MNFERGGRERKKIGRKNGSVLEEGAVCRRRDASSMRAKKVSCWQKE